MPLNYTQIKDLLAPVIIDQERKQKQPEGETPEEAEAGEKAEERTGG